MSVKNEITSKGFKNSFFMNVIVIIGICTLLYFIFFATLGVITKHGEEVKVPQLMGKKLSLAKQELEKLGFDIQIDSAYDPSQKPLTILNQQPEFEDIVKPNRTIFLTVNKIEPPLTPMPNLNGLSFRSALLILNGSKLKLGDTSYRPDIAQGAVLDQLYQGEIIRPGQMLPQGSKISLVLGDGLGNTIFDIPDIVGLTYAEAVAMLSANNLLFSAVATGEITDTATAIVYKQIPSAINELGSANQLREGDELGFFYMQNATEDDLEHGPSGAPVGVDSNQSATDASIF